MPAAVFNGTVSLAPARQAAAQAGKYWTVTNPTPGTAIAYALQTSFSATANGLFGIQNRAPLGSGIFLTLDYLKLIQTATAPTATLSMRLEAFNETGLVTLTGNVAARTPVMPNQYYQQGATNAVVQSFAAGAATVPAQVQSRVLQSVAELATGVAVQYDTYIFQFGGMDIVPGTAPLAAARSADPAVMSAQAEPVVVAPQSTTWLNLWWLTAATSAPSFEFALTYFEGT